MKPLAWRILFKLAIGLYVNMMQTSPRPPINSNVMSLIKDPRIHEHVNTYFRGNLRTQFEVTNKDPVGVET